MMRTTHFMSQCDAFSLPADSRSLCPGSGVDLRAVQSGTHDQPHPRYEIRRVNPSLAYSADDALTHRQAKSVIARFRRLLFGTIIVQTCIRPVLLVLALALGGLTVDDAEAAADGNRGAPPMLVTADMLHAKIGEAERNPDLDAKGRASLTALYRDALSNLGKIDAHTARANAFAEIRRTAPQETDLVRQRSAALKAADPPSAVAADTAMSGVQIERDLKREEADLAMISPNSQQGLRKGNPATPYKYGGQGMQTSRNGFRRLEERLDGSRAPTEKRFGHLQAVEKSYTPSPVRS